VISSLVIFSKDPSSSVWCNPEGGFETIFMLNMTSEYDFFDGFLSDSLFSKLLNAHILSSISVTMSIANTGTGSC